MDFDDLPVPGAEAPNTLGDAQVLAVLVGVPGGACSGCEANGGDDHCLAFLMGQRDRVKPDVTGELCGWVLGGWRSRFDIHGCPTCCR